MIGSIMHSSEAFVPTLESALRALCETGPPLFAILDAAQERSLPKLLGDLGLMHRSLFSGRRGQQLDAVAPYLVQFSPDASALEKILAQGLGKRWGIFMRCERPFEELRRHLRRFLVVETEQGQTMYFRFYDPFILRIYLPSTMDEELLQWFGPISSFYCETMGGQRLIRFSRMGGDDGGLPPARGLWTIREEQLEMFGLAMLEAFEAQAEERYGKVFRGWVPPSDIRVLIRDLILQAERHGMSGGEELDAYLGLIARYGRGIAEGAWAQGVLERSDLAGMLKLKRIERRLRHWAMVKREGVGR